MDENIAQELLHELFTSLEALETQNAAILSFLKAKGIVNDEELAPHFEQAGNASSVRWRAARVRMDHLLSAAMKSAEEDAKAKSPTPENHEKSREDSLAKESGSNASDKKAPPMAVASDTAKDNGPSIEKAQTPQGENGDNKTSISNAA